MAPTPTPLPRHVCDALGLTKDEVAFREGSATIVLPTQEAAFLNPVQEFNRDLSVLALRAWSDLRNDEKRKRFEESAERRRMRIRKRRAKEEERKAKRARLADGQGEPATQAESSSKAEASEELQTQDNGAAAKEDTAALGNEEVFREFKFDILEALSATGLRSIRYAREVPLLRNVLANDLSTTAVEAMRRNVALNFPAGKPLEQWDPASSQQNQASTAAEGSADLDEDALANLENGAVSAKEDAVASGTTTGLDVSSSGEAGEEKSVSTNGAQADKGEKPANVIHPNCKISISEADAITLMYAHRDEKKRFDVIDLDPYGSASIFLDGAVQSVNDGGLLCITCTDTAVMIGTSHPEKCYSAYGGVTAKAEYAHEIGLRLLLHAIATSAGRYGKHIEPLLSLSIDFYVRVFVRVHTRPVEVKKLASSTGVVFTCVGCQLHSPLPFGRHHENETHNAQTLIKYQAGSGPNIGPTCAECGSRFHTAGPMWLGPLHDPTFCQSMLAIVEREPERFGTRARIQGMVGTASEELVGAPETMFFFTPSRISSFFRCTSPPLLKVVSALLHAGYRVSRSHCQPGSLKTTASRQEIYDLWRAFVQRTPVKMESISESSPAYTLLTRPSRERDVAWELDVEHPDAKLIINGSASSKGTRYQINPLPNWGPGTAARTTRAK